MIRFHELRSYKISALTNLGVNTWAIMRMTGKKVSGDINVYLTGVNLKEIFKKCADAFTLTNANNVTKIPEEFQRQIDAMETTIATLLESSKL